MKRGSRRILQSLERFAACGGRFACSVRASLTMASGVGRRPASQVRSVSRATPRAVAHSAWDRPSRVRTSLRAEACLAIGHDDAISPPLVGSEGIAMKTRGSRPLRNGSTTAGSISVGRFRPGVVTFGMSPDSAVRIRAFAKSGQIGAPSVTTFATGRSTRRDGSDLPCRRQQTSGNTRRSVRSEGGAAPRDVQTHGHTVRRFLIDRQTLVRAVRRGDAEFFRGSVDTILTCDAHCLWARAVRLGFSRGAPNGSARQPNMFCCSASDLCR